MIMVDGKQISWHQNMTLDHVVAALEESHIYAVVRLNGKPVCRPHFTKTVVVEGDIIEPIPLIAGG